MMTDKLANIINTDSEIEEAELASNRKTFSQRQLRDIVQGQYHIINLSNDTVLIINADQRDENLEYNPNAQALYKDHYPDWWERIKGTVLHCDRDLIL